MATEPVTAEHAALNFVSTNVKIAGEGVIIIGSASPATPSACQGKFVPMPQ